MSHSPSHTSVPSTGSTGQDNTMLWLLRAAKAVVVFVYAFVLVEVVMLALGFLLRLFGASTDAEFTRWVYRSVERIMEPFRGMFPTRVVSDQSVIDVSLLFAMIVYAIAGIALHALVTWLTDKIVARRRRQGDDRARGAPAAQGYLASPYPPGAAPTSPGPTTRAG